MNDRIHPDASISKLRRLVKKLLDMDLDNPGFGPDFRKLQADAKQLIEEGSIRTGNPAGLAVGRVKAQANRSARAQEFYAGVKPAIKKLREEGMSSYEQIAKGLDDLGIKPPRAGHWSKSQVHRIDRDE